MNSSLGVICTSVAVWALAFPPMARAADATDDEAAIRVLEQSFADAVIAKDVDKTMAIYERGQKLVFFDVVPRREHAGWDAYKRDWQGFLSTFDGPVAFEISDLQITVVGDLAYGYNFSHVSGQKKDGSQVDHTVRVTDVYRKTGGNWLIVHEHVSVPVDMKTGKAALQSNSQ
jgi:ketosteroid isomerase-like protein